MLAFLSNLGLPELVVILVIAVLIFGKDLPQAASKAYLQVRKLRGAVDDLRRDSGIERELREIERNVREAEWEARKKSVSPPAGTAARSPVRPLPAGTSQEPVSPAVALPAAPAPVAEATPSEVAASEPAQRESALSDSAPAEPPPPTGAAS